MKKTILALIFATAQPAAARDPQAMFEDVFPAWVANSAWLDFCSGERETRAKVNAVLDIAEKSFFPGWFDGSQQAFFRDKMDFEARKAEAHARTAKEAGYWKTDAITCVGVREVEQDGRRTIGAILDAAAKAN